MPETTPLGLPGQNAGLPTVPLDKGDDTQERFRYQWAMGLTLIAEGFRAAPIQALWCEYHEDFLVERLNGDFIAVQVKTIDSENALWRLGDTPLDSSIHRFCGLEAVHGSKIRQYEFCSNAQPYVPGISAKKDGTTARSPIRLIESCRRVGSPTKLAEPSSVAFEKLRSNIGCAANILLAVLQKLSFRRGPSLRDYDAVLASEVIPTLPGCEHLPGIACRRLRDNLMGMVQTACRVPRVGLDGVLAYIATNGQPEVAIREKCIPLESARNAIATLLQPDFRFVHCGLAVQPKGSTGRTGALQKKLRNAFLGPQFEPLRWRMESAEQRLMERALTDSENFEEVANQLTGTVLTICKDAEAEAYAITDDELKGQHVYAQVLHGLKSVVASNPQKVFNEPVDTLIGVAGMLSGECRFAWGVPLHEETNRGA
jgi:hypothetical protein